MPIQRILIVHNVYREKGGEEIVVRTLQETLERNGLAAAFFERRSSDYLKAPFFQQIRSSLQIPFSIEIYLALLKKIRETGAQLIHAHNIFPFISPSVYAAAKRAGIPVVHTLHNYRLLCVNGLFLRDGKPCERCLGGNTSHAVAGRCYGGNIFQSFVMAANLLIHRTLRTWRHGSDAYIALSKFSKRKFVEGGLPEHKIHVMPNMLEMAKFPFAPKPADYLLFLGRLSQEKGLGTLLRAYEILSKRTKVPPLEIIGDGPMRNFLLEFIASHPTLGIHWHGRLEGNEKIDKLKKALLLVFPSECYENCPLTVLESLAVGTPVVGSRLGGTSELIRDQETGALFSAADSDDLARVLQDILANQSKLAIMRANARKEAETRFDVSVGLPKLLEIYEAVSRKTLLKNS